MTQRDSVDVATAVAGVRARMAELDAAIAALRAEATRLRTNADQAVALALLDPPRVETGPGEALVVRQGADRGLAFGIVAAELSSEPVDPEPGARDEETDTAAVSGADATVDAANDGRAEPSADVIEFRPRPEAADGATPTPVADQEDSDDLAALEAAEPAGMPADWDAVAGDEDAFDKFFSSDVEPEPAQRWLLNDL